MPITNTDLDYRFSVVSGAVGNSVAGTAAGSLGGKVSTTSWANNAVLFDDISGAENAASTVDFRCIFVVNNHGTLTLQGAVHYITGEVAGGASVAIGTDPTAASVLAVAAGTNQAVVIANEVTPPAGVTFTSPTTVQAGAAIGNLPNGQCRGLWARRTAANTAAVNADGFTWNVAGDTAA